MDIVGRLRAVTRESSYGPVHSALDLEAAAEIERLRAALDRAADALEFYDNKAEAQKARAALESKP